MSFWTVFLILNIAFIVGIAIYLGVSVVRNRRKPEPPNQTAYLDDDTLETKKLERVGAVGLLFVAIIALALPLYWLREPTRQDDAVSSFDDKSVSRGATLYANSSMEAYDPVRSLACANCHGANLEGGTANAVIGAEQTGIPGFTPVRVAWRAPSLNTALYKFPVRKQNCGVDEFRTNPDCRSQVYDILVYGRQGTPMQPWGVEGGGAKNSQSIQDLVNYIASEQLSEEEALAASQEAFETWKNQPQEQLAKAQGDLETARTNLAAATEPEARAQAEAAVANAEASLAWAQEWVRLREGVSDGQILFETNCARCHTKGWSYFDPTRGPSSLELVGPPGGGGVLGFALNDGATVRRFPGEDGRADQITFIQGGSQYQRPYGVGGIGSGRMPAFGQILTQEQIEAIVDYERSL